MQQFSRAFYSVDGFLLEELFSKKQVFGEIGVRAQDGKIEEEVKLNGEAYYVMEFNIDLDIDLDDIKSGYYEK